ncbi:Lrp/AsnC family transcriptional regulator [Bdellovibrionota bacterium FG-2]
MDATDIKIVKNLMENGRIAWKELAHNLRVSAPTIAERVRKLEEQRVIVGYGALVNPSAIGLKLTAFISITLARPDDREPFLKKILKMPEIQECHHVAGDYDYLLKVRCSDTKALDKLLSIELKGIKGIVRTRTTIVLDSTKETSSLPCSSS